MSSQGQRIFVGENSPVQKSQEGALTTVSEEQCVREGRRDVQPHIYNESCPSAQCCLLFLGAHPNKLRARKSPSQTLFPWEPNLCPTANKNHAI